MPSGIRLAAAAVLVLASAALADSSPQAPASDRVLLVPLNLAVRAEPAVESGIEPVWQELVRYLEGSESRPASLAQQSADALWRSAIEDPEASEAVSRRDVYAAYGLFARRVAEHVEFESIVIPSLVTRRVKVHGRQASWDGVRRSVYVPQPAFGPLDDLGSGGSLIVQGVNGAMSAASLHVAVLDRDGRLRFEGAGGLTLLEQPQLLPGDGSDLRLAEREAPFEDAEALREGVEAAFANALPASRAKD